MSDIKKTFLVGLDLNGNQIDNLVLQNATSAPATVTGKVYYDSTNNVVKYYDGTKWVVIATADQIKSVTVVAGDASIETGTNAAGNTTVAVKLNSGLNDLKLDANGGLYVTPYTADGTTLGVTGNQFYILDTYTQGVKDYADAAVATGKAIIDAYTVNGKAISTSPTLDGSDVNVSSSYAKATGSSAIATGDSIDAALGKVEYKADKNTGDITTLNGGAGVTGSVAYQVAQASNAMQEALTQAIEGLDNSDAAVAGQFVTAAVQTDGTVTVSRDNVYADQVIYATGASNTSVKDQFDAVEAKLPGATGGAGITVTPNTDQSTGKVTYQITTDATVWHFKGTGYYDATTGKMYTDAEKQTEVTNPANGDVYAVETGAGTGNTTLYAWDGDQWINIGAADGVQSVDTTATNGVQLTFANGVVGVNVTADTAPATGSTNLITSGAVYTEAQAIRTLVQDNADGISGINAALAIKSNTYVTTATGTAGTATIAVGTHKCGTTPVVTTYLNGEVVETAVSVNGSGDVTVAWNSVSGTLTIKIVG